MPSCRRGEWGVVDSADVDAALAQCGRNILPHEPNPFGRPALALLCPAGFEGSALSPLSIRGTSPAELPPSLRALALFGGWPGSAVCGGSLGGRRRGMSRPCSSTFLGENTFARLLGRDWAMEGEVEGWVSPPPPTPLEPSPSPSLAPSTSSSSSTSSTSCAKVTSLLPNGRADRLSRALSLSPSSPSRPAARCFRPGDDIRACAVTHFVYGLRALLGLGPPDRVVSLARCDGRECEGAMEALRGGRQGQLLGDGTGGDEGERRGRGPTAAVVLERQLGEGDRRPAKVSLSGKEGSGTSVAARLSPVGATSVAESDGKLISRHSIGGPGNAARSPIIPCVHHPLCAERSRSR